MTEFDNQVLAEQIRQLRKDFNSHKIEVKEDVKEVRSEIKELEINYDKTRRVSDEVNNSMKYVTKSVDKLETMVSGFVNMITTQNTQLDHKLYEQNLKIDDFINSDKRRDSKKQFVVSILQVLAGILATILTFWASGKI